MEDGKTAWRGMWSHAPGGSGTESWRQILRERCFPIRYEGRQYATLGADTGRLGRSQSRGPKVEGRRLEKHLEITWRAEGGEPEGTAREKPAESHPGAKAECRMQNRRAKPPKATPKPPTSYLQAACKPGAWEVLACCHRIPFVFSSYSLRILFVFSWYSPLVLWWCASPPHGGATESMLSFDSVGLSDIQMKAPFPEP
jgi:hypothetical protein